MTVRTLFRDARVFDGTNGECLPAADVLVEGGTIASMSATPLQADNARIIDCAGRTLMPGLIDAHVHVYAASLNLARSSQLGPTYLAHYAREFLQTALDAGFTTVRDVGGGDRGLATAIADGLLVAPRLVYGGRVISQTGGHGDFRSPDQAAPACGCAMHTDIGWVIVDGPDAVRTAVREELRRGASHIKIMASGGVTSPTDPIDRCQFSEDEIRVAVEEATRWGGYVAAHCHPDVAIRRCLTLGVRSIEHATLIEPGTAALAAERDAFLIPTLSILDALLDSGPALGLSKHNLDKLRRIADRALAGLETMRASGARIGFGTDLIGPLHHSRGKEFLLRAQVQSPLEILRSACSVNAALLQQSGQLGCIATGAIADLLVVNGDPLSDISLLARGGESLAVIMQGGRLHKCTL